MIFFPSENESFLSLQVEVINVESGDAFPTNFQFVWINFLFPRTT